MDGDCDCEHAVVSGSRRMTGGQCSCGHHLQCHQHAPPARVNPTDYYRLPHYRLNSFKWSAAAAAGTTHTHDTDHRISVRKLVCTTLSVLVLSQAVLVPVIEASPVPYHVSKDKGQSQMSPLVAGTTTQYETASSASLSTTATSSTKSSPSSSTTTTTTASDIDVDDDTGSSDDDYNEVHEPLQSSPESSSTDAEEAVVRDPAAAPSGGGKIVKKSLARGGRRRNRHPGPARSAGSVSRRRSKSSGGDQLRTPCGFQPVHPHADYKHQYARIRGMVQELRCMLLHELLRLGAPAAGHPDHSAVPAEVRHVRRDRSHVIGDIRDALILHETIAYLRFLFTAMSYKLSST